MKTLLKSTLIASFMLTPSLFANMAFDINDEIQKHKLIVDTKNKKVISTKALKLLDKVLSPFEDMTEYALANDISGMKKGYKNILSINESGILKQSVSADTYQKITSKIVQLKKDFNTHNNSNIALVSTELFESIVDDFKYATYIKNQLHIEKLDGMGFELLSRLTAKDIDYNHLYTSIANAKIDWIAIREGIHDKNAQEAFDLLLKGLAHASVKKDKEMIKILASMDLALVDVLEQQFK
ncbi:MAG TPA: hypothetical protein ENK98_00290 [Epsilonproteobacteria bacterium]|nr:hypothetical protein [Campylobacterota bacterium]